MEHRRRYHPRDFSDAQWRRLLQFALERSDAFECAVPYPYVTQDIAAMPLWPKALADLRSEVIGRHVSYVRWGRVQDSPTQFVRLRVTPAVAEFTRSIASLEAWSWGEGAPEDPTFLRGETVILSTESPFGRIAVFADSSDLDYLNEAGVHLIEPLNVKADPWPTP